MLISPITVIGGGPAGSLAAIAAQQVINTDPAKGYVTVIEKKDYASKKRALPEKVCAGLVPESGLQLMDEYEVPWKNFPRVALTNMVFSDRGHLALDDPENLKPYYPHRDLVETHDIHLGSIFGRDTFDAGLLNHARQVGARVLTGTSVSQIIPDSDGLLVLRKGKNGEGDELIVKTQMVIGAFGANLMLGEKFAALMGNYFPTKDSSMGYAYRAYVTSSYNRNLNHGTAMHCRGFSYPYNGAIAGGYLWTVDSPQGVNFGVMGFNYGKASFFKLADFKYMFPQYYGVPGTVISKKRGAPLPMWEPSMVNEISIGCNNTAVVIVGDAAGYVDPLTGEGIQQGMQSGANLGAAMAQAVLRGDMLPVHTLAADIPHSRAYRMRKASHLIAKYFIRQPDRLHLLLRILKQHPYFGRVINDYISHRKLGEYLLDPRIMNLGLTLVREPQIRKAFYEMIGL
ncbi:NAD(P)/FAD-dependent oxidoreductase [bacterium]|nr:NAD(P)/FAD-dependent oxidoreductase [bacterium]